MHSVDIILQTGTHSLDCFFPILSSAQIKSQSVVHP